jgi:hypothetical protein
MKNTAFWLSRYVTSYRQNDMKFNLAKFKLIYHFVEQIIYGFVQQPPEQKGFWVRLIYEN